MQSIQKDNLIIIRLFNDELLIEKIIEIFHLYKIKTGIIISGLGQLKNFQLGYFKGKANYSIKEYKRPYELLSLTGNICKYENDYEIHLHAVLSNEENKAIGGHLIKGIVEVTNEIVILTTNVNIKRRIEKNTGLKGLFIE